MEAQPKKIGRYEIVSLIGRGATGIVYKAQDPLIGRAVAVKRVSIGELLPDEERREFHERFLREARAAGGLRHPNIIVVHDVGEHEGLPFMAMEYLEGGSLASLMRSRGALPIQDSLAIVRQVAAGLAYAHRQGIVHRDVKPDNILLDKDGRIVITDFGAARLKNSELTRTGEVLGTPYYMSPEQVLGNPLDGRSDLFSLGVIFYLMVTGQRPFKGDTITTICYHIVHSEPEPIPADLKLPSFVLALLDKLLAKKRDERFASGEELIAALDALAGSTPTVRRAAGVTQALGVPTPVPPVRAPSGGLPQAAPGQQNPPESPSAGAVQPPGGLLQPSGFPPSQPSGGAAPPAERSQKLLMGGLAFGSLLAVFLLLVVAGLIAAYFIWLKPEPAESTPTPAQTKPQAFTTTTQPAVLPALPPAPQEPALQPPSAPATRPTPPPAQKPQPQPQPQSPPAYVQTGTPSAPSAPSKNWKPTPAPAPVSQPAAGPDPALAASTEALAQQAANAVGLANDAKFGQAFRALDDVQEKMQGLAMAAAPQDQPNLEAARARVERSQAEALQVLANWAKGLLDTAQATYRKATHRINDDEEGIERAYAQLYPVLKWKERLPPDLQQAVTTLVQNCRENLNDDEWAQAEALAKGQKKE